MQAVILGHITGVTKKNTIMLKLIGKLLPLLVHEVIDLIKSNREKKRIVKQIQKDNETNIS
jgi:hypothetical protein